MNVRPCAAGRTLRGGRTIGLFAIALLLLFLASCGEDSAPSAPDTGNLDADRAVSAQIGASGGTLDVTDADGAAYRLEVPSGALRTSTNIIATPYVEADTGNDMTPLATGLLLEPEGLAFLAPVTMSVTLPTAPSGGIPALLHRSGDQPGEVLVASVNGNTLSVELNHFSELTPVAPSLAQLIEHWNLLMFLYGIDGPNSDLAQQLTYTFLTGGTLEGIPFAEWEADLNGVLAALIVVAVDHCNAGDCILGSNQLATAGNLAAAINNADLVQAVDSQTPLCDTSPLDVAIGFGETIESATPSPLTITVTREGTAVEGAAVSISVTGGSAAAGSGTTDAGGAYATTVLWDDISASVVVNVTATHPGCPSAGNATDTATPTGLPKGVAVESRDSEVQVILSASFNLNPGSSGSTTVYDLFPSVEYSDPSGTFSADTTRTADGKGGDMTMSGSATASQMSSVTAPGGNSVEITFTGDVSGAASLSTPPGGDTQWQSYSAASSDMSVDLRVFESLPFQVTGAIDGSTDFSFTGNGVSICYVGGQPCPEADGVTCHREGGVGESGVLVGDPDGGALYHFSIRVEEHLSYQQDSSPNAGSGNYSGMANVTLTIGP